MTALADTSVLVYRFDPRDPRKQAIATEILRRGLADDTLRLPHQAIIEFVAAVTRPLPGGRALLNADEARREADEMLTQFVVVYPTAGIARTALRGAALYGLEWFDAHLWAYAEEYGFSELLSEDFQHDRQYGTVRVVDPFA
ncbi:MAG: PIN domain-containing protein [Candidatus Rokubacteria bacterium]|nr:PIN domain-containing protein [Candidatus Rokubacteria bacterium]